MKRLALGLIATMFSLGALANPKWGAQDVIDCMQKNMVDEGALRKLDVTTTDSAGGKSIIQTNIYWRPYRDGVRVTLHLTKPDDLAGLAYLIQETDRGSDELFAYFPATGKARKVTGNARKENLWRTSFSYEEIKLMQGLALSGKTQRKPDAVMAKRPAYVLESNLDSIESDFGKAVVYVDQKSCTVLKAELSDREGQLAKVLEGDVSMLVETSDYANRPIWMLLGYTMKDVRQNIESEARLSEISLLEKMDDALFKPDSFYKAPKGGK